MIKFDFSQFETDIEDDDNLSLDDALSKMKSKIDTYSSDALCSIIASDRHLKINSELQVICLQELDKRRSNGDDFDFESKINEKMASYPKININIGQLSDLFNMAKNSMDTTKWTKR